VNPSVSESIKNDAFNFKIMKIRWLGNSCVEISAEKMILIDPNYVLKPEGKFDLVLVTHEHSDHIDPEKLKEIRYDKLLAPKATLEEYNIEGIEVKPGMEIDEVEVLESWCWKAKESVSYLYKGILHTGDSSKFPDVKADVVFTACFPDFYDEYVSEMKRLKPKLVIPIHYNPEKPEKRKNAKGLKEKLEKEGINCKIVEIGEVIEV